MFFEIKINKERVSLYYEITDEIILKEGLPLLVFSNKNMTKDVWSIYFNFDAPHDYIEVELRSITEDYYKYMRSLYLYRENDYVDFLTIGNNIPYPVYSNVEKAYGIFAGYTSVVYNLILDEPW